MEHLQGQSVSREEVTNSSLTVEVKGYQSTLRQRETEASAALSWVGRDGAAHVQPPVWTRETDMAQSIITQRIHQSSQ